MDGLSSNDDIDDFYSQQDRWQIMHLPVGGDEIANKEIKMWEAQELLIRNISFINDIGELKQKYSESGIDIDSVSEDDERHATDQLRKEFYKDARNVTEKIHAPGYWLHGVWDVILGLTPVDEISCYHFQKSIVARKHNDHIDVKIYGNVTVKDLRDAAPKIRKHIETLDNLGTTDDQKRKKKKFEKSLLIYQMKEVDKKTNAEVAEHFNHTEGLDAIAPNEVSNFLKVVKEQIEDSYA